MDGKNNIIEGILSSPEAGSAPIEKKKGFGGKSSSSSAASAASKKSVDANKESESSNNNEETDGMITMTRRAANVELMEKIYDFIAEERYSEVTPLIPKLGEADFTHLSSIGADVAFSVIDNGYKPEQKPLWLKLIANPHYNINATSESRSYDGRTILTHALLTKQKDLVRLLLNAKNINPSACGPKSYPSIFAPLVKTDMEMAQALLSSGVAINIEEPSGNASSFAGKTIFNVFEAEMGKAKSANDQGRFDFMKNYSQMLDYYVTNNLSLDGFVIKPSSNANGDSKKQKRKIVDEDEDYEDDGNQRQNKKQDMKNDMAFYSLIASTGINLDELIEEGRKQPSLKLPNATNSMNFNNTRRMPSSSSSSNDNYEYNSGSSSSNYDDNEALRALLSRPLTTI